MPPDGLGCRGIAHGVGQRDEPDAGTGARVGPRSSSGRRRGVTVGDGEQPVTAAGQPIDVVVRSLGARRHRGRASRVAAVSSSRSVEQTSGCALDEQDDGVRPSGRAPRAGPGWRRTAARSTMSQPPAASAGRTPRPLRGRRAGPRRFRRRRCRPRPAVRRTARPAARRRERRTAAAGSSASRRWTSRRPSATPANRTRPSVRVPVLSTHSTSTRPSASTVRGLRTTALWAASRRAPASCAAVATNGSPSGTDAMARLTAVLATSRHRPPAQQPGRGRTHRRSPAPPATADGSAPRGAARHRSEAVGPPAPGCGPPRCARRRRPRWHGRIHWIRPCPRRACSVGPPARPRGRAQPAWGRAGTRRSDSTRRPRIPRSPRPARRRGRRRRHGARSRRRGPGGPRGRGARDRPGRP